MTHSCNFFGPYQYPEKLIPLFITNLLEGKQAPLYGQGDNIREWIYTQDHCRAIDLVLHQGRLGEVYNIGTAQRFSNLEITQKILAILDLDDSRIEYVVDRPGHDWRYALDSSKLRKELGFKPSHDFDQGLEKTINWYKANQTWWEPLKQIRD